MVFKAISHLADKILGNTPKSAKKYKSKNHKGKKGKKKSDDNSNGTMQTSELQLVSSSKILIKVFKHFGSNTSYLKAKYIAFEQRDVYGNLVSINEEFKHNEDTDFSIDDIYREMNIVLEFKNSSIGEKLKILDRKIQQQNDLLKYLDKYHELNSLYNYADEALKARDYNILRGYIKHHDENGAYFTIEDGLRVYSFESVDGTLVPIWHGVDTYTKNPDHTRKTKVNIQEDARMRAEMAIYNKEKRVANVLITALIFCMILFCILLFASYKVWEKNDQLEARIHASTFKCTGYVASMAESLTKINDAAIMKSYLREEPDSVIREDDVLDISPEKVLKNIK